MRIDSTVTEADVKYPTDAGLASSGVRTLAPEGRKLAKLVGEQKRRVRDRSRSMGRKLRAISRTIRRRSGDAKEEVLKLTQQTGEPLERSIKEARRLAAIARRKARGRGAAAKLKAAGALEGMADRCEKVAKQIKQRVAGEPIKDRIVSLSDPDARPIRKGKLGKPTEFGFVSQLAEVTENTKRGARGLILPATTQIGNPSENTLLPGTVAELQRLGSPRARSRSTVASCPHRPTPRSRTFNPRGCSSLAARNQRRSAPSGDCGATGPARKAAISHLKRRYGLDRSRLKGDQGRQIRTEWAILAYNTDTLAVRTR